MNRLHNILAICICTIIMVSAQHAFANDKTPYTHLCPKVDHAITLSQNWLMNMQHEDGFITYKYYPFKDDVEAVGNIVRQIGSAWAVLNTYEHAASLDVLTSLEKFDAWITAHIQTLQTAEADFAYIEVEGYPIKLNTLALYLIYLLDKDDILQNLSVNEKQTVTALANSIRGMATTRPDHAGGFYYIMFLPEEDNRITAYGSAMAYYALARYYQHIGDMDGMTWVHENFQTYFDNILYKSGMFKNSELRAFMSWGLPALKELHNMLSVDITPYINKMIPAALSYKDSNDSCKDSWCISAPNMLEGPFLEGFTGFYDDIAASQVDKEDLDEYLPGAVDGLLGLQVSETTNVTDMTGHIYQGETVNILGGFCKDATCEYMRNDLNQHATIALLNFHKRFCK